MSFSCELCGKGRLAGNKVSNANNKTHRFTYPNIQTVKALVKGGTKRIRACTRCIRSGFVKKAA
ncbi:MAG: 50S ribosomal protein L28 [Deltaproteobacteria bacterium]|nr:50S ribosomal protein L28 [Deltaproteobacteria bacterium]